MFQRACLIGVLFLSFIVSIRADLPVLNIRYSDLYATSEFVKKLLSYYPPNSYKAVFENSAYSTREYISALEKFETLRLDYNYEFEEYPFGQKIPVMSSTLLDRNLIRSESIEEFKSISYGIIPSDILLEFAGIIELFLPVYREIIFEPGKTSFGSQIQQLQDYIDQNNIVKQFNAGLAFYNTTWDFSIPFEIVLLPTPQRQGFSARAFLNIGVSEIPVDFTNYDVLMSVLMHEIYHIFYDNQALEYKNKVRDWFWETRSMSTQYAYLLFNEALATAMGNGYVYEQLNGAPDEGEWYNIKYINLMAKAIYPMVKDYVANRKSIDAAFVRSYVKIYDDRFSDWTSELPNLMAYRHIVADDFIDFNFFRDRYRFANITRAAAPISSLSLDRLKMSPVTKIIVVSKENSAKLALIKSNFEVLKNWKYNPNKEFLDFFTMRDGTKLLIINRITSSLETVYNKFIKQHDDLLIH